MKKIAIIGGGASGIMAAMFASGSDNKVTVFEKQKKTGRKILASGNGRCNLSNRDIDLFRYHGKNPKFILNIFSRFGLNETIDFFQSIGIPVVEEKDGRLFPESLHASSIMRIFEYELKKRGAITALHHKVDKIIPQKKGIKLITAGKEEEMFDSVILSAGSCAYPQLGGSLSGYEIASSLGHTVIDPFPSILPVNIPQKAVHRLEGIKRVCRVLVETGGKITAESYGDLLFTKYGISGTAALDISRAVNSALIDGRKPSIIIDFFPGLNEDDFAEKLNMLLKDKNRGTALSLTGILRHRMCEVLLSLSGIDPSAPAGRLDRNDRENIVSCLKALRLEPGEPRSFREAVVAAGGVDVDEINPSNMESKIIKNLYITGELLDIDGDSGGYNLQFAWSTGAVAGIAQHK